MITPGRYWAYRGYQAQPSQMKERNRSGRWFGPQGTWVDNYPVPWASDCAWFTDDGYQPALVVRGPWGSPKPVVNKPIKVEYQGYHLCQMSNRLNKLVDGVEDTWRKFMEEQHCWMLIYAGQIYPEFERLPADEQMRQLWISTRPMLEARCDIGIDTLSKHMPGASTKLFARWLESMYRGMVWGESVPLYSRLQDWDKFNIVCTQTGYNKFIKTGKRTDVRYTAERDRRFMLWLQGTPPKTRAAARRQMRWCIDRRLEGYDVALPIGRARKAGYSCQDMMDPP